MARFANEKDLVRVNELRKQVNDIHVEGRPDVFKPGFGRELQEHVYTIYNHENKNIIVVEREGIICGMACVDYVTRPESPFRFEQELYHVSEIAVDKAFQRQGIATEMFEFMKQDAKNRGIKTIELDVWSFNTEAKEFYDAVGFQCYRNFMEYEIDE